ncbi:MAG: hypothetical protein CFH35_00633, partial [Alphaproteobacteria bacterium MarineAlpha9_Bin5]
MKLRRLTHPRVDIWVPINDTA